MSIETLGAYGAKTKYIIKSISQRIAARQGDQQAAAKFRQSLSLAIQKGNAKVLSFSLTPVE